MQLLARGRRRVPPAPQPAPHYHRQRTGATLYVPVAELQAALEEVRQLTRDRATTRPHEPSTLFYDGVAEATRVLERRLTALGVQP